jgi:hypothetical protein
MALRLPELLTAYTASPASSQSSSSKSYDYSGLDDLAKKQDAIGALRDAKFEANFRGDPSAVTAGNKVRDLVKAVRAHLPAASERDPGQSLSPLVRVTSETSSGSASAGGGTWQGMDDPNRKPAAPVVADGDGQPAGPPKQQPKQQPPQRRPPAAATPPQTQSPVADFLRRGGARSMHLYDYGQEAREQHARLQNPFGLPDGSVLMQDFG